jgi:hypothetical protein
MHDSKDALAYTQQDAAPGDRLVTCGRECDPERFGEYANSVAFPVTVLIRTLGGCCRNDPDGIWIPFDESWTFQQALPP